MSWAITETKRIMREAITRFADQLKVPKSEIQIIITTYDENGMVPVYRVAHKGNPAPVNGFHPDKTANDHVTFLQILGLKIDFLNYEAICAPFMAEALDRFAKELQTKVVYVNMMILTDDSEGTPLGLQLFRYEPANPPTVIETYTGEDGQEHSRELVVKGKQVFVRHMEFEKDLFGLMEEESQP